MFVCMCFCMYLCISVNIKRQYVQLICVSTSIYFCVDSDVSASIWIAYNSIWCVNGICYFGTYQFYTM